MMLPQVAALAKAAALAAALVPVPLSCQLSDNWCYLAVSEMVANYSGVGRDQCNILRLKNGEMPGAPCSCGAAGVVGSPTAVTNWRSTGLPPFGALDICLLYTSPSPRDS